MQKKILIVDDHLVVRTGVSIILEEGIKNVAISEAKNFNETLDILKENTFDLIILDINIPGGRNTLMIEAIRNMQSDVKILVFSVYEEETHACPYIIAGANGYLNKLSDKKKIVNAVETILKIGNYISQGIIKELVQASTNKKSINPLDILSKREREISELLVQGDGNIEIANKLNIQLTTVSTHKNKMFNKLNIKNVVELVSLFNKSIGVSNVVKKS
ncbi:response regulator [Flavobacterium glaciei]|uniref:DNA-binding NarL/FixJ family response regulator n=1 Tax=Flavobacterium glaciei TaxID=386300 RepID=A0A562PHN1_9FLAO|nr:response regulator transcription factor [Flavobacterium glaciei]RDI51342.1 LuxR family two component transcriptional regulator [Flavobacterium glaciei]TWI43934.1 DNA-binding NarL/FixJ family response regulator [Flavobacterium glaciei]